MTPGGTNFLFVLQAQNRSEQQKHANVATFGARGLLFTFCPSLCILFPSFLVPGTALNLADVSSCSLRLFLPFLKIAAGSWLFVNTETKVGAAGRQRAAPLYKITGGDPWGYQFPVCFTGPEQIRTAKARQRCNFWWSRSAFHFFPSLYILFPSFLVPGTALNLADVSSCSLRLFLPFLKVAAGSWLFVNTETKVEAMGRQQAVPLYKITRGDPWGYQVPVGIRNPEQTRTAKARQRPKHREYMKSWGLTPAAKATITIWKTKGGLEFLIL